MQHSRENFDLFRVYFDALIEQGPASPLKGEKGVQPLPATHPSANNGELLPVQLPSGQIHVGWPHRADTAERMVNRYRDACQSSNFHRERPFHESEVAEKLAAPQLVSIGTKTATTSLNSDLDTISEACPSSSHWPPKRVLLSTFNSQAPADPSTKAKILKDEIGGLPQLPTHQAFKFRQQLLEQKPAQEGVKQNTSFRALATTVKTKGLLINTIKSNQARRYSVPQQESVFKQLASPSVRKELTVQRRRGTVTSTPSGIGPTNSQHGDQHLFGSGSRLSPQNQVCGMASPSAFNQNPGAVPALNKVSRMRSPLVQADHERMALQSAKMQRIAKMIEDPVTRANEIEHLGEIISPRSKEGPPMTKINGVSVQKNDIVVKLLQTCVDRRTLKHTHKKSQQRLMDRISLDRPTLQNEKMQLILFEKNSDQLNKTQQQSARVTQTISNAETCQTPQKSPRQRSQHNSATRSPKDRELNVAQIRQALVNVHKRRKADNHRNMRAYQSMVSFFHRRGAQKKRRTLPSPIEVQLLEVFKKLTESGWIIGKAEFKQITDFVGVTRECLATDRLLVDFIRNFLKCLGLHETVDEFMGGSCTAEPSFDEGLLLCQSSEKDIQSCDSRAA